LYLKKTTVNAVKEMSTINSQTIIEGLMLLPEGQSFRALDILGRFE